MTAKTLFSIGLLLGLISCAKENIKHSGNEKLTKIETLNPANQITSFSEYKYDGSGKLIEISGSGTYTGKQALLYDASGKIISMILNTSVSGNVYKYDFQTDLKGRIIKATGTAFQPNLVMADHIYTYDAQGRLIIDSLFNKNGSINSYFNFEYDKNDNIIAYQQYVNQGTSIVLVNTMSFKYDNKRSPYFNIGQLLYTSGVGSDFYLSRNNQISASLNGTIITPGGHFVYEYYPNSLLKTSTVNEPNSIKFKFYYSE